MQTYRIMGEKPYKLILIPGGRGKNGSMHHIADGLKDDFGVVEVFVNSYTLDSYLEQINSLIIEQCTEPPVILGYSFGGVIAYLYASRYQNISKLITLSSGSLTNDCVAKFMDNQFKLLTPEEKAELILLSEKEKTADELVRYKELLRKKNWVSFDDKFDMNKGIVPTNTSLFNPIFNEVCEMRNKNELLEIARKISVPVVNIWGEDDSWPPESMNQLENLVPDFKSYALKKCAHVPFTEKYARKEFFDILKEEIEY